MFHACSGEWWKSDTEAIIKEALKSGLAPNVSDAHTINGHPGSVQQCASQGETYYKMEMISFTDIVYFLLTITEMAKTEYI